MSLTLTLKQGDDFYLNDQQVTIKELRNSRDFTLTTDGRDIAVNAADWTRVASGVFVQAGNTKTSRSSIAKVCVQTDGSVRVRRGVKYRQEKAA